MRSRYGLSAVVALSMVLGSGGTAVAGSDPAAVPLVRGQVLDADGGPASDAQVLVLGDAKTTPGAGVATSMPLLGKADVTNSGTYAVEADPGVDLTRFADAGGIVTLFVVVTEGSRAQLGRVQGRLDTHGSSPVLVSLDKDDAAYSRPATLSASEPLRIDAPMKSNFDLSDADKTLTSKAAPSASAKEARSRTARLEGELIEDYGPRPVFVGQFISLKSDAVSRFEYTATASSTLGVAVSASGAAGSFSAGTTKEVSSAATTGWDLAGKGIERYRVDYRYVKNRYTIYGEGDQVWTSYEVEPVNYEGGADRYLESDVPWPKICNKYGAGTDFTIDKTEAYTYDYGVSTAGMIDVALSAKSGFSESVKHHVEFPTAGYMCGLKGNAASTNPAPQVISVDVVDRGGVASKEKTLSRRQLFRND